MFGKGKVDYHKTLRSALQSHSKLDGLNFYFPRHLGGGWSRTGSTFMTRRFWLAGILELGLSIAALQAQPAGPGKLPADRIDGPPLVSAKAWAIADGKTGKLL